MSKKQRSSKYDEVITRLPEADLQFEGARAWIMQADSHQLVFFEFAEDVNLPGHIHSYPQWGMIIAGKMELTIDGIPKIRTRGDEYLVPAEAIHSVRFISDARVMDFFSEKPVQTQSYT